MNNLLFLVLVLSLLACNPACSYQTEMSDKNNKHPQNKKTLTSEAGRTILTGPIVSKNFIMKNGKSTDKVEYYLRASVQDYFIKFCESKVSKETLESYLKQADLPDIMGDKVVSLEVEIIREGSWDICESSLENQQKSRIGDYIIVHSIQ